MIKTNYLGLIKERFDLQASTLVFLSLLVIAYTKLAHAPAQETAMLLATASAAIYSKRSLVILGLVEMFLAAYFIYKANPISYNAFTEALVALVAFSLFTDLVESVSKNILNFRSKK
ncbi:MAG: hypothetical protein Q8912_05100 [Bacillota bacterium]|nr:hypothetical protein [Bacillota bacterium]